VNYSDSSLNKGKEPWLLQTVSDLNRMEGFREFPYPDPLSKLGKRYTPAQKYGWGFQPADMLLAKYGEKEADGVPWTYGAGFTKNVKPNSRISRAYSDKRLEDEIIDHVKNLHKLIPKWESFPLFAKTTVANLIYNLGYERLAKFHGTLAAFNAEDWDKAAANLTDSLWFKQVGNRSRELVARLQNKAIDPKHLVV
jgi:Phage lysozyme.